MVDITVQVNESCDLLDLSCHWTNVTDWAGSLIVWAYEGIVMALAELIESIPLPDFFSNMASYSLPSHIAWAASPFMLAEGAAIIASAYTLRFIIRRLPIVG